MQRIRSLYHRAIHILDADSGLDYLCTRFVAFEQRCGDLEALHSAERRCRRKREEEALRKRFVLFFGDGV